jgi:ACS family hexuronate transporter-like MFS transporter
LARKNSLRWRWFAVLIFVLSSTLNFLDRQLLSVLAPLILADLHSNQLAFGYILSAFSIAYAICSLFAGLLLDRFGLNKSIAVAVAWWSGASISTIFTQGFRGLLAARVGLAIGESAGVPSFGKLNAIYLKPSERALGTATNQVGLSAGAMIAPLAIGIAANYGWRAPFALSGALGLMWIPVWLVVSRSIPPTQVSVSQSPTQNLRMFADINIWLLICANVLWMGSYSLWLNWTTLYLTHVHHLSLKETAHYVWIPPLVSNLGGFFGGWLSFRWINRGTEAVSARRRAIWVSAAGALATLTLPLAPGPASATALISLSFFFSLAGSVNIYALPIDIFGADSAGTAIAALTFAFGLLQAGLSPVIGFLSDRHLYNQVVWLVTLPLFCSAAVLMYCRQPKSITKQALTLSN